MGEMVFDEEPGMSPYFAMPEQRRFADRIKDALRSIGREETEWIAVVRFDSAIKDGDDVIGFEASSETEELYFVTDSPSFVKWKGDYFDAGRDYLNDLFAGDSPDGLLVILRLEWPDP